MKKTFRRALSLTIASGLTLAMAVTAGAAEGDTLTRGEMAKLLVEGAGLTGQVEQYQAQESVFQDVPEDSEYKGYINLAYAQGLVSGTGADTFSPDAQTTQVEAAAVTEEVSLTAVPAKTPNASPEVVSKPIICPNIGNRMAASTLKKKMTEIACATSSSSASMTGAVAAMAEPPQMEEPTPTSVDILEGMSIAL